MKEAGQSTPKPINLYTLSLTQEEIIRLKTWCQKASWEFFEVDHAAFAYRGNQVNVVAYKSGKIVIQGKKTQDFVTFVLEGEITHKPKLGYDEFNNPTWFEAHAGLDESGKGDVFGPLVTACVIVPEGMAKQFIDMGIKDSKAITSDGIILKLDQKIRKTPGVTVKVMYAGMSKYNELYEKFGQNLNTLLAWMHSKSLGDALTIQPVSWGLLDQFSKQPLVQKFFKNEHFDLRMQTKAESDPIVAAASIVARATYVQQMEALSEKAGETLLKGASNAVLEQGKRLVAKWGPEKLGEFAKLHFKTAYQMLGLPEPEKKSWTR